MRMGWKAGHSLEQGMRRHSSGWEAGRSPARGAVKPPPGSQSMLGSLELQCWAAVPVGTASGAAEGCLQHEYSFDVFCLRSRDQEQHMHLAESVPVTLGMGNQGLPSGPWQLRIPDQLLLHFITCRCRAHMRLYASHHPMSWGGLHCAVHAGHSTQRKTPCHAIRLHAVEARSDTGCWLQGISTSLPQPSGHNRQCSALTSQLLTRLHAVQGRLELCPLAGIVAKAVLLLRPPGTRQGSPGGSRTAW